MPNPNNPEVMADVAARANFLAGMSAPSLTVAELRNAHARLQDVIFTELLAFQRATGLTPRSVDVDRINYSNSGGKGDGALLAGVRVRVEL